MKILVVLTVRNEGAYLLEWLAHHRAAGISDFLIYSNDCDDGTELMLDRLAALGLITHIPNPGPYHKGGIQFTAMKHADTTPEVAAADWIITLDVDEFINIHTGDHTIPDLLAALPDATAITLTWRLFGSMGLARYEDTPVLDTFTHAAPEIMFWPWRAAMFKTLFRNDGTYGKLGIHRPRSPDKSRLPNARWFDGHGRALPANFATARIFSPYGRPNYGLAQLNHYPLGSMENFVIKADRGRAVHSDHMLDLDYWVERNYMIAEDRSIDALATPRAAHLASLHADAELSRLHRAAVDWRKSRFLKLLQDEPFRALYGRLLQTPPTRPVSKQAAAFLRHHAALGKPD
ncbi:glycosyltransferase family 2 protein [Rhodobacteraceae bacterium D3-12]|nr:glycosyltransferase family 2 protein [Rhodobacteraceae bacterium D3-12]